METLEIVKDERDIETFLSSLWRMQKEASALLEMSLENEQHKFELTEIQGGVREMHQRVFSEQKYDDYYVKLALGCERRLQFYRNFYKQI